MTSQTQNTSTLHILNKTPGHPRFKACLAALSDQDMLVLIENAVLALADTTAALPDRVAGVEPDLQARGLSGSATANQQISHNQLVQLTERYSRIISW